MTGEKQRDFARRVTQANKTELVAVTCDIIRENIDCAAECLKTGDVTGYRSELKSAGRFLAELIRSLDFRYPIAKDLLSIYEYVQRILVSSEISGKDRGLAGIRGIISRIGSAFEEIAPQDTSGSVMENSQQIYAGLTYGKGTLNEADMAAGTNRGFLA
jgi:flagellar protein FliS